MKKLLIAVAAAAAMIPAVASAQDTTADGSRAFGIDPYVGVMGGYEGFDTDPGHGTPSSAPGTRPKGGMVEGVVGTNIPTVHSFCCVEGHGAYGFWGERDL